MRRFSPFLVSAALIGLGACADIPDQTQANPTGTTQGPQAAPPAISNPFCSPMTANQIVTEINNLFIKNAWPDPNSALSKFNNVQDLLTAGNVTGARSVEDARRCAKAIANSPLVKTAIHGGDPNWGRLIAVAGRAGVAFELERAEVTIGPIVLFKNGRPYDDAAPEAANYLAHTEVSVGVNLGVGPESSTVWTCDLSADYVRINAEYRT